MKRLAGKIGAGLVVLLAQGCVSQMADVRAPGARSAPEKPPAVAAKEQTSVSVERMQTVLKNWNLPAWRAAALTPGFVCPIEKGECHIKITVFQSTDTSTSPPVTYCLGIAPEFVVIEGNGNAKRIVWEMELVDPKTNKVLDLSADVQPPGSTLSFLGDEDHGILIIKNIYDNQGKVQLKEGKREKDQKNLYTQFGLKNDHKANGKATYLPIIVHTVTVGGVEKVALCGTPDPAIYNVD